MQVQGYIQEVGYDINDFWKESNKIADQQEMDGNLAYMYVMINHAVGNFYVKKDSLIDSLDESRNFKTTHEILRQLKQYKKLNENQIKKLLSIAVNNHPVRYILKDSDVNCFYI